MKSKYRPVKQLVQAASPVWQERMRLGEWEIEHLFLDSFYGDDGEDEFKVTAVCEARHQYFSAKVKWYLPSAVRHDPVKLEQTLVHELCHVMLAHEQSVNERLTELDYDAATVLVEIYAELRETSTEMACRALWKAWGSAL